jgi:hypothetical protein
VSIDVAFPDTPAPFTENWLTTTLPEHVCINCYPSLLWGGLKVWRSFGKVHEEYVVE